MIPGPILELNPLPFNCNLVITGEETLTNSGEIVLSPNSACEYLEITSEIYWTKPMVINALGQPCPVSVLSNRIVTTSLQPGVYFLELWNDEGLRGKRYLSLKITGRFRLPDSSIPTY